MLTVTAPLLWRSRYSPYAFTYRHSGLVSCGVDYTPYAFTYHNSGLVPGYGICSDQDPA